MSKEQKTKSKTLGVEQNNPQTLAEKFGLTYVKVGDYYLPNIALSDPPNAELLNRYGMMRKQFIKKNQPIAYSRMLSSETLYPHCREIQQQANERKALLMEQLLANDSPPDKEINGLEWARHMDMLNHISEEIVLTEIIYDNTFI